MNFAVRADGPRQAATEFPQLQWPSFAVRGAADIAIRFQFAPPTSKNESAGEPPALFVRQMWSPPTQADAIARTIAVGGRAAIGIIVIVAPVYIVMATVVAMTPIAVAPSVVMPPSATVAAMAIAVPPPAAIAGLLDKIGLIAFQRQHAARQRTGARTGCVSAECQGHRAAERDDRKQFPHIVPLFRNTFARRNCDPLCSGSGDTAFAPWQYNPNPSVQPASTRTCGESVACARHRMAQTRGLSTGREVSQGAPDGAWRCAHPVPALNCSAASRQPSPNFA